MFDATARAAALILMFAVLPLWILAGLADYFCHRASSIETTSGPRESALHLLQLSLVGIPVLLALFLQIDAALLATMIACLVLHHTLAYFDIHYANTRRRVRPVEQMVHSFLELMPLMAFALLCILHWDQAASLFGFGPSQPDFNFRQKIKPLPFAYVAGLLTATFLFNVLPYAEEMIRTLRARRKIIA
jgi:hypothetical protein